MRDIISRLRAGWACWDLHALVMRRWRVMEGWGGCMLCEKDILPLVCAHICSRDSLVGHPVSEEGLAAGSSEAKR
jgi:hypothetical protein